MLAEQGPGMKSPPFTYHRPSTLQEAVGLLRAHENSKVLAGGQSLMSMLNLRYLFPDALVDINRVAELAGIDANAERVRFGAMTRQRAIERDPAVARLLPVVTRALTYVGHRQTRNRGTIGGSLCHLDPAAELPTLALLHDAVVEVAGISGTRRMPIVEFIAGFMTPAIDPDEIVSAVEFPIWPAGHGWGFHEFSRRHGDFAIASAACLVSRDGGDRVTRAAIAVGGVGTIPQRLPSAETVLVGSAGDAASIEDAVARCVDLDSIGDFHGSADYRVSVARSMLRRALRDALGQAGTPSS